MPKLLFWPYHPSGCVAAGVDHLPHKRVDLLVPLAAAPNSVVATQNAALVKTRQNEQPADCRIQGGADLLDTVLLRNRKYKNTPRTSIQQY